jgi:hypothetical protein
MKNLMIYLNPRGFDPDSLNLIRIQIENALELGWDKEDMIVITDFPYEHEGIKSITIERGYCDHKESASKMTGLGEAFNVGIIEDHLYWCHDLDAYQLEPITEDELGLDGVNAGLTDYGRKPQWQLGSFFFKRSFEDLVRENVSRIKPGFDRNRRLQHDEHAMNYMTDENIYDINNRIKRLNITYNFGMRKIGLCYEKAIKPLKVLHFHPNSKLLNTLAIAMYGKNDIRKPLMNGRLISLFKKYGYE